MNCDVKNSLLSHLEDMPAQHGGREVLSLPEGLLRRRHWRHRRRGLRHLQVPHGRPRGKEPRLLYSANDFYSVYFWSLINMNCFPEQLQPDMRRRGGRRVRREQVRQVLHRPRRVRVRRLPQGIRRIALREVCKEVNRKTVTFSFFCPCRNFQMCQRLLRQPVEGGRYL